MLTGPARGAGGGIAGDPPEGTAWSEKSGTESDPARQNLRRRLRERGVS